MGITVARFASSALPADCINCYDPKDSYSETTGKPRRWIQQRHHGAEEKHPPRHSGRHGQIPWLLRRFYNINAQY